MDLRDSSSMVAIEGCDEDGAVLITGSLAKDASALFQSEKFAECVEVLNRLLHKKRDNPKILHNIAVAEFFRDGCSEPKKLMEILVNVKKRSEDLARASTEKRDLVTWVASKTISGAKGNGLPNDTSVVSADEFDASVAALNIATILFHLHEYQKALSVLEPLFQNIEQIDETAALHLCLLSLDAAFVTQDVSKLSDVISYLEKACDVSYMANQAVNGSTAHQQASNFIARSTLIPNISSASEDLNSEGIATGSPSEGCLSRTLSDETMEYENLYSTLGISGQRISRPSNLSRLLADRSTPMINLKLQLPLYKIQLLILTGHLKTAKREIKLAMNIACGVDSSRTLQLKSHLEYARGNYPKAIKLLRASSNQGNVGSSIVTNNNIGCIYYEQGKHNTSSIFFHKALNDCSSHWKEKTRKLATFSQDKSLLIAYNCGLQYLACGKPDLAGRCFLKASLVFYKRPLLWLRLAECCLMALEKGLIKPKETLMHESEFGVQVIGQGKWRHLCAQTDSLRNGNVNLVENNDSILDGNSKLRLSMPLARQCLLNALHLLESSELKIMNYIGSSTVENELSKKDSSKNTGQKSLTSNDPKSKDLASSGQISANGDAREVNGGPHANSNTISEHEEICRHENEKIKQGILVNLAFVELELGNPLRALSTALSLLNVTYCSKMYAFLAHIYAAEALCLLNRPKEATELLSAYLSGGITVEVPYTEEDSRQWLARKTMDVEEKHQDKVFLSPEEARETLYVNLASMYALQGDLEQASRYATQALALAPKGREAAVIAVYLDLKLGKTQEALSKLKRFGRVRFLPLSSRSKGAF